MIEKYALYENSRGVFSGRSVSDGLALGPLADRVAAAGTAFLAADFVVVVRRRTDGLDPARTALGGLGRLGTAGLREAGQTEKEQKPLFQHRRVL